MPYFASYPTIKPLLNKDATVLDFGCGAGQFLQQVGPEIKRGVGVDLDESLVTGARSRNPHANVEYLQADARAGLPFPDRSFDVIVALGVLEHVGPEAAFIREFHRLLRDDGRLVIDVPSTGPFRALDIGNIKYNFPRLHRWFYYYVARQRAYYDERFGPNAPMFGQFSREASGHKHYSVAEVAHVSAPWFRLERHEHYGLFFELIQFSEVVICKPFRRGGHRFFGWLLNQDCRLRSPIGRANIVTILTKERPA
jgi:SAM-dependent methyltransferase